ncbi:hypothetical protein QFC19_001905 [Naganishia cerealis]|uniref:Uncharacterized protein n=1 Tax=Naganishia cerealis TaxID=610337 RepID=A0ACC2WFE1_9TREE|nr:hypothetical protein QFC19_001905 [Naganishia cerealis]
MSSSKPARPHGNGESPPPELPAAPPTRVVGEGYGYNHPAPTVQKYRQDQVQRDRDADEYAEWIQRHDHQAQTPTSTAVSDADAGGNGALHATGDVPLSSFAADKAPSDSTLPRGKAATPHGKAAPEPSAGQQEKAEMMDRMNANKQKPTDRVKKQGERRVRDPTTGGEVIIKDADPEDFDSRKPALKGSNVLLHPFPPPRPASLNYAQHKLQLLGVACAASLGAVWLFTAFGHGFWRFARVSFICGAAGAILVTLVSLISRNLEEEMDAVRLDMHRQRGEIYSPPTPESVEWLNNMIKLMWGLIDPGMFISITDMVEDIMQQSLPGFVEAVRISDFGQGTNPLRILSIRALADEQGSSGYPKDQWINKGDPKAKSKDTSGKIIDEDAAGDYYNFEVAFAYSAVEGKNQGTRAKNIHLLIEFFLGAWDWFHLPIPIWIQVEGIAGVVRLRMQMIQEFPYVRNLTFTLCGVPHVDVSCVPMSKKLPDVLDLPLVSNFVKMAIAAGTAEMCAPKSMTLNLKEMLSGAALGDTTAIGVFVITIHFAEDLSAQDSNGKSDPYVFGKPLYSTRIILGDLNPVWEETAVLLLTMDEIRSKEDLSAMLWDSDKRSAELTAISSVYLLLTRLTLRPDSDLVGRIQIPVSELMKNPNQMIRREDSLKGFEDADEMTGKLHWSIGYFEKVPLKKELERLPTAEEAKSMPAPDSKTPPEMEMRPNDAAPNPAKKDLPPPPPDVQKTRPDPEYPSGVFNLTIHHAMNVERQDLTGRKGNREGQAGQDTDELSEQNDNLPSPYCEVIVNDDLVFKTRVKQYSTQPFFEAPIEVFVRDWQDSVVRVVMRDSRVRESDPILGVVSLRMAEVFAEASSVTSTWAITEGQGFGKINMSLAFRGIKTKFPRNMIGWNTGTLDVGDVTVDIDESHRDLLPSNGMKLSIKTSDSLETIPKNQSDVHGTTIHWDIEDMRIPIYMRYQSSVVFELGSGNGTVSKLIGKNSPQAIAVLWLQDLTDDVEQQVKLPIFVGKDLGTLRQNAINDQTAKHHDFEVAGWLTAILKLDSGLDQDHENDRVEGEAEIAVQNSHANDDGVIDKKEKKSIDDAHKRQLEARGRGPAQFKAYRQAKWMHRVSN